MPINSRSKGARGEREVAALLREYGYEARRGQQRAGGQDSPDVIHTIEGLHLEVKHVEKLNIWDAYDQACRDCGENVPTVVHRKNRRDWLITMRLRDYLDITNDHVFVKE